MKTMISQYQVRLFHNGRNQTLNIPHAFEMPSNDVVIRKEGERLIIEPFTANSDQTRYKSNKLKLLSMKDYIWQRIH